MIAAVCHPGVRARGGSSPWGNLGRVTKKRLGLILRSKKYVEDLSTFEYTRSGHNGVVVVEGGG